MKIKKYKDQFITSTNYWSFVNISTQKDSTRRKIKYFLNKYLAKIFKLKIISSIDVNPIIEKYTRVTFPSLSVYTGYRDTSFTSLIVKK
jgi:hypothetical protein